MCNRPVTISRRQASRTVSITYMYKVFPIRRPFTARSASGAISRCDHQNGGNDSVNVVMRCISCTIFHLICYGCVLNFELPSQAASQHHHEKCQYALNRLSRLQEGHFDLQFLRYIYREEKGRKVKGLRVSCLWFPNISNLVRSSFTAYL